MSISSAGRDILQRLVINQVTKHLTGQPRESEESLYQAAASLDELMTAGGGCFVTYKTNNDLRGCLGCFTSPQPLWKTVHEFAELSLTQDNRFWNRRLRAAEMPEINFEISVLSPLQACSNPLAIRLGIDGIYLKSGGRSGCFLPQVASETRWTVEEFWSNCAAHKAGLPAQIWRSDSCQRYTFTVEIIEGDFQ